MAAKGLIQVRHEHIDTCGTLAAVQSAEPLERLFFLRTTSSDGHAAFRLRVHCLSSLRLTALPAVPQPVSLLQFRELVGKLDKVRHLSFYFHHLRS